MSKKIIEQLLNKHSHYGDITKDKTLQFIGDVAKSSYKDHRESVTELQGVQEWADASSAPFADKRHRVEYAEDTYDMRIYDGKALAEAAASQLHDLAVIEAHLGGVAINVEQPLSIGEQIEVHKP